MNEAMIERLLDRDEVWKLFCEHYWDSLQKDRDLILCHVDAVLRMARDALEQKPSRVGPPDGWKPDPWHNTDGEAE